MAAEPERRPTTGLQVIVVTPEKAVLDTSAEMVVLPLFDGEYGVLAKHAPLIGRLAPGELRVKHAGAVQRYFVDGGFAQVRNNVVTILTARALPAENVTATAADAALTEAEKLTPTTAGQREAKSRALERGRAMMKVAKK
jgi:F-type H+-transporting ATPase subunit epsilon